MRRLVCLLIGHYDWTWNGDRLCCRCEKHLKPRKLTEANEETE